VLDQPASCGDFPAGQAFTADDVYVGSHLRFDLSTAKSGDVRLTPERKIAPQLFGIEGITSRTIGVRSAQSLPPCVVA
jgi:hypothetical protein